MDHNRLDVTPRETGLPVPPDLGDYNIIGAVSFDVKLVNAVGTEIYSRTITGPASATALGKVLQDNECPADTWNEAKGAYLRPAGTLAFNLTGSNDAGAPTRPLDASGDQADVLTTANGIAFTTGEWTPISWAGR